MERDELLIDAVGEYPWLYNSKIPDFKVQLKKENAWTAVAELLERCVEDCQKRWKTLRERFVKEIKKKKRKSGDGATVSEGNMQSPVSVVDLEEEEEIQQQESEGVGKSQQDDSTSTSPSTSDIPTTSTPQPPPRKKFKRPSTPDDIEREILKELRKEQAAPLPPDEDDLFGQSIGASLKKMFDQQKALAKMKIQQLLYEIQYCNVQPIENTCTWT